MRAFCVPESMRIQAFAIYALFPVLALPLAGLAQADCSGTLSAPLHSGSALTIDSVSLGMKIVRTNGNAPDTVRVSCSSSSSDESSRIHMKLSGDASKERLKVTGDSAHNRNPELRIEVPRHTNLRIRMAAGEVTIDGIEGDKDCELTAGQITISDARAQSYRNVDASVDIGEVKAAAYGQDMGGFFRHFHRKSLDGDYHLHAHVMTGEIDLLGSAQDKHGAVED